MTRIAPIATRNMTHTRRGPGARRIAAAAGAVAVGVLGALNSAHAAAPQGVLQGLLPPGGGTPTLPAVGTPRAIALCADDTGSVPPLVAQTAVAFFTRALRADLAAATTGGGYPATQVEVIKLGADSYTPSGVVAQGFIPAVHPKPTNPFLNSTVRQRILTIEGQEQAAAQAALTTLTTRIAALRFPVENRTDLLGCPERFADDTAQVPGRRRLVIASDLEGAAPGSDHAAWRLGNTTVDVYLYCSDRSGDNAASCQGRRTTWTRALTGAGAGPVTWYTSDNLVTASGFGV